MEGAEPALSMSIRSQKSKQCFMKIERCDQEKPNRLHGYKRPSTSFESQKRLFITYADARVALFPAMPMLPSNATQQKKKHTYYHKLKT